MLLEVYEAPPPPSQAGTPQAGLPHPIGSQADIDLGRRQTCMRVIKKYRCCVISKSRCSTVNNLYCFVAGLRTTFDLQFETIHGSISLLCWRGYRAEH